METIKIQYLNDEIERLRYIDGKSDWIDLCAAQEVTLRAGEFRLIPLGVAMELPAGYEMQVRPRSGLAAKYGVTVLNAPGTIDADYRGEIKVILVNLSDTPFEIKPGERIAQIVVARHERVEWEASETLSDTARGAGGFGSTGR